ncbi:hypothetical protein [Streptomyces sp. NPDC059828]|uniref:hypothetical protein n=1 Tax=Streptomyces sp. NPDC059828 TaxID=3346965 RepID=UPI003651DDFA
MAARGRTETAIKQIKEGEQARNELADALKAAGVTLPSLRLDPCAYCDTTPLVLIDLGRCNVDTARALTAALRAGVPEGER